MAAKKKKKKKSAAKKRKPAAAKKSGKRKKKRTPKNLAAAIAAFSGESRHDDSYVAPAKKAKRLTKKQRKALTAAAMAAWSGESRHGDPVAAVVAKAKKKKLTKKERAALTQAAMAAWSGESRHGPKAEYERNMRLLTIAEAARRRQLSNPRKSKREAAPSCPNGHGRRSLYVNAYDKKLHCLVCGAKARYRPKLRFATVKNPIHFPKSARGRPARKSYWILDVYKGKTIRTYIGSRPVDKTTAKLDAMMRMNQLKAEKVALSGPYRTKPTKLSLRK